jgi:hypothetical protein
MNARGEKAMNFSQTATTHHFRLLPDGGYVQVQASSATDTANRDHIRMHLQEQAKKFSLGDFSAPELTHGRVLPGVPQMQKLKASISYQYQEIDRGGRRRSALRSERTSRSSSRRVRASVFRWIPNTRAALVSFQFKSRGTTRTNSFLNSWTASANGMPGLSIWRIKASSWELVGYECSGCMSLSSAVAG